MSDLFSSNSLSREARIFATRDLKDQPFISLLRDTGFTIEDFDEARGGRIENSIIACYPGKGRLLDEKIPASSFLVLVDADDALERVLSKRCFFIDSRTKPHEHTGVFEALDDLLSRRKEQLQEANKIQAWEEKVQEALSGFEYLVKSLPMHAPGDVNQDEGLADLLDFFVRVLVFKERSVSITAEKQFWDTLITTFDDFVIRHDVNGEIPVGRKSWSASEKKTSKYSLLKIMGLAFLVGEFADQLEVLENQRLEESLWEEALAKIPNPIALVSVSGDLVAHNAAFTQLGIFPADCLRLRAQQKLEASNGIYRVEKIKIDATASEHDEGLIAFLFRDDANKLRSGSGEELGIISSSIAHELNNPLAGVLASLSLLELEDDLSDECFNAISDMKKSAKRCKELVEIFLGFSRATPRQINSVNAGIEAFDKAISLSRFRMIENNSRVDIETSFLANFHRETNASILAMVWYLVLGEILTAASHHSLVTGRQMSMVKGRFIEREYSLELILDSDFDWGDTVLKSKLLLHLVELAGLSMTYEEGKLILKDWTLM